MSIIKKILPLFISLGLFIVVLNFVEAPQSWQSASAYQLLSFIVPLLFFFIFLTRLFIRNLILDFLVGLTLLFLFVLKITGLLTWFTGSLFLLTFAILIVLFAKYHLTYHLKIPKLSSFKTPKRNLRKVKLND